MGPNQMFFYCQSSVMGCDSLNEYMLGIKMAVILKY